MARYSQQYGAGCVDKLGSEFGSRPEDIIAFIGPSICASCYEVGEDVAENFFNEYGAEADKVLKIKRRRKRGKSIILIFMPLTESICCMPE